MATNKTKAVAAKKPAVKKPAAVKSPKSVSPSETSALNGSTPSAASSAPTDTNVKWQNSSLSGAHGSSATPPLFQKAASVKGDSLTRRLNDALMRTEQTLAQFRIQDRSSLYSLISFFERFWVAISATFELEHSFVASDFEIFQKQPEFDTLVPMDSYARFEFSCGSRAIVLRSLVGTATFYFAANEFVSSLKNMKTALPELIKEQMAKNKPTLSLMTSIPIGLMALVRDFEEQPRLSLDTLHRVFGDPLNMLLSVPQENLAGNVQALKRMLVDLPPAL